MLEGQSQMCPICPMKACGLEGRYSHWVTPLPSAKGYSGDFYNMVMGQAAHPLLGQLLLMAREGLLPASPCVTRPRYIGKQKTVSPLGS